MATESELSGIGFLALNSKRESQVSLLADDSPESLRSYTDDRHWSWTALRNTFQLLELQTLFKSYARRIQNAYFNVYLLLQMLISVTTIVGLTLTNHSGDMELALPEVGAHALILAVSAAIFCATLNEALFRKHPWTQVLLSCVVVLLILGCDVALTLHFYIAHGRVRTASAFQLLIIVYFFLPLPCKLANLGLGILVSAVHLILSGLLLQAERREAGTPSNGTHRTLADAVYYLCGNVVGVYAQLIGEVTIRRAFLDRRGYIQSTIKKTFEKGQEEHLLLSILPWHIASKVKEKLVAALQEIEDRDRVEHRLRAQHVFQFGRRGKSRLQRYRALHKKPFSDLFVDHHTDVSILFADIVNFTPLTVTLRPDQLVATLNQLFGRFDQAAHARGCLRIKLIGDCYLAVSGLPTPTPHHAHNCVQLGLDMIEVIRDVRRRLRVDVAMRIGVHSGAVISGIIGIYKWHFDVWSRDTLIANRLEATGKAGRVHVSRQTKDILQNGDGDHPASSSFEFTPEHAELRDAYLAQNNVQTFLVVPPSRAGGGRRRSSNNATSTGSQEKPGDMDEVMKLPSNGVAGSLSKTFQRRGSATPAWLGRRLSSAALTNGSVVRRKSFLRRTTDITGENVVVLRQMLNKVNDEMAKAIDEMPLRKFDQWFRRPNFGEHINPLLISLRSWRSERRYQTQPDPLFKYYLASALFVLLCIGAIQALVLPGVHLSLWAAFCLAAAFLLALLPLAWASYVWNRLRDPHREREEVPQPENKLLRLLCRVSTSIATSLTLRLLVYVSVAAVLSTFAIIDVVDCRDHDGVTGSDDCRDPWYFTYSCTLAILGIHGFFRVHFLLKLLLTAASLSAYALTILRLRMDVFANDEGASPALRPESSHVIYLLKIVLLLHFIDRQMEYINRLDFLWKKRLTDEHHEAARTHEINTILLHNILPPLIARLYLDPTRTEVHSRSHADVAVMFASIPNFTDFYTENDFHEHGIRCLQLLNEIIVEFDQALVNFLEVEKIKVIGSTYMAAAGLQVRDTTATASHSASLRRSTADDDYAAILRERRRTDSYEAGASPDVARRRRNLLSLVGYATTLMKALRGINKDAFQNFQLRVGLDAGPVVAGVIGTSQPHYDIWGDTVNMASRLESTGVGDRIHLGRHSANLLEDAGVPCVFRDRIRVKGKQRLLPTHFVLLNKDFDVQHSGTIHQQDEPKPEITRL